MATPEELEAIAGDFAAPNDEIVRRAAKYLRLGGRAGLETAHNMVVDALNNVWPYVTASQMLLAGYAIDLRQDRIEIFGAVGRPADMTAPYWKRGW